MKRRRLMGQSLAWLGVSLGASICPGRPPAHAIGPPEPVSRAADPAPIKAAYLSYFGLGDRVIRERTIDLLGHTVLNGIVIDVKGDRGFIPYDTGVSLARDAGALGPVRVRDFDETLARLKDRGIYTIARVVVFKDNVLALRRPEWALLDARTRKPWLDNEGLAWLDPFREETGGYAIAVAREAALKGFDEIQFDYLRFPSEGALSALQYSMPNRQETREHAISEFLRRARMEVGARIAVDIFGYTAFNTNDTNVGQRVEALAMLVDYLCPMAYPSAYHRGIPGYPNPVAHPYGVVFETVRRIRERAGHAPVRVRPWIQDFRDYAFDHRPFGVSELQSQMKGAADAGASGWMVWNPRNAYTTDALKRG